jgi:hypothetical protein
MRLGKALVGFSFTVSDDRRNQTQISLQSPEKRLQDGSPIDVKLTTRLRQIQVQSALWYDEEVVRCRPRRGRSNMLH